MTSIDFAASSQNSLAGGNKSERQTVARVNLDLAVAAILSELCQATPMAIQKFLDMRCYL